MVGQVAPVEKTQASSKRQVRGRKVVSVAAEVVSVAAEGEPRR